MITVFLPRIIYVTAGSAETVTLSCCVVSSSAALFESKGSVRGAKIKTALL